MAQTNANLIWKIADLLRGPYQPNQYGDVILPFTILRRLDCILEPEQRGSAPGASITPQPVVGQQLAHLGHLCAAAHETGQLHRKIMRTKAIWAARAGSVAVASPSSCANPHSLPTNNGNAERLVP